MPSFSKRPKLHNLSNNCRDTPPLYPPPHRQRRIFIKGRGLGHKGGQRVPCSRISSPQGRFLNSTIAQLVQRGTDTVGGAPAALYG